MKLSDIDSWNDSVPLLFKIKKNFTWALRSAEGFIAILIIDGLFVFFKADFNACWIWSGVSAKYPSKPSKASASFSYLNRTYLFSLPLQPFIHIFYLMLAVKLIGGKLVYMRIIELENLFFLIFRIFILLDTWISCIFYFIKSVLF